VPTNAILESIQLQHEHALLDPDTDTKQKKSAIIKKKAQKLGADIGDEESNKQMHTCLALADTIGDSVLTSKLREITTVFQDFAEGQMSSSALLEELDHTGGVYSSELMPILVFIGVDVPRAMEDSFRY
jgi:hypothetical protein